MDFDAFKEACFSEAAARGCGDAEIYYAQSTSSSVDVLEGAVESYEVNTDGGANLRVKYDGKSGYAFTQKLDEPDKLVIRAIDNAMAVETADEQPMQGKSEYRTISRPQKRADELTNDGRTELALELERTAKAADSRVVRVMTCTVAEQQTRIRISNTRGLDAADESRIAFAVLAPVTKVEDDVRTAYAFRTGDEIFDIDALAAQAVANSVMQHGGAPVAAGKYRVLIRNDAMTELIAAFSPMFSGEAAQKGLTLFADKLGEKIAADILTITDDPLLKGRERPFDGEGVPSVMTKVVDKGVLRSFLYDLKSAKKAGVASTSNGGRAGAAAPVSVMPSNFFIEPGVESYDALVEKLEDGLVITSMSGMHAGLSTVSGEFSLIASGLLVEGGRVVRPVEQITVGGSFVELISSVTDIGCDAYWSMPGKSSFSAPSMLFEGLMVSGK